MTELHISNTRLVGTSDFGAAVEMQTNKGIFGLEAYAPTQSDLNAADTRAGAIIPPGNVVAHIRTLNEQTRATMTSNPAKFAKAANTAFFTRLRRTNPGTLRVAAAISPGDSPWRAGLDASYVRASTGVEADVIALPSRRNEDPGQLMDRLRAARDVMASLPPAARLHVAPTVRLDSKHFIDTMDRLVDSGAKLVILEFHGSTGMNSNLGELLAIIKKAKNPPYVIAINVPRIAKPTDASGALWATSFGVQASAVQLGRFFISKDPAKANAALKWFVRARGGYVPASTLSRGPGNDCGCPDAPSHLTTDATGGLLAARKRHDGWAHLAERDMLLAAILGDAYQAYLARRDLLAPAVW